MVTNIKVHIIVKSALLLLFYLSGVVDYDDGFMSRAMSSHDPPDLWLSTPDDQFPDPNLDLEGFMTYCGESFPRLTAYLWLVTREMVEKGEELKPIAMHEPFVHRRLVRRSMHEAPHEDSPSDGPPPSENLEVPPEAAGAGPVYKRHDDGGNTDAVNVTQTKKMMRCSQILAPLQVKVIVHTRLNNTSRTY